MGEKTDTNDRIPGWAIRRIGVFLGMLAGVTISLIGYGFGRVIKQNDDFHDSTASRIVLAEQRIVALEVRYDSIAQALAELKVGQQKLLDRTSKP